MKNCLSVYALLWFAAVMVMTMAPAALRLTAAHSSRTAPTFWAPKTNSMVVVWESTEKVSATIAYGTDESKLCDPIKGGDRRRCTRLQGQQDEPVPLQAGQPDPGTRYYYEVKARGRRDLQGQLQDPERKTGSDPSDHPVGLAHFCDPRRTRSGHQGI